MTWYSINGANPQEGLPSRITLSDGRVRTDPTSYTAGELTDAGVVAVDDPPSCDPYTEERTWTGSAWSVSALSAPEIAACLVTAKETKQDAIDAQYYSLLDAGKTLGGKNYRGGLTSDAGAITVSRERGRRKNSDSAKSITAITRADPVVLTAVNHGFDDVFVLIEDCVGMTEMNDSAYNAVSLANNTFKLQDLDGNDVDSTGFGVYVSGGTATPVIPMIAIDNTTNYIPLATADEYGDLLTDWYQRMSLRRREHKDAVAALTTVAAVQAYDSSAWPT